MPLLERSQTQILAAHLTTVDQTRKLIAGVDPASPCVGMLVDTHLVQPRRVDTVQAVRHTCELKGASIPDDRAGGEALVRRENSGQQDNSAHRWRRFRKSSPD